MRKWFIRQIERWYLADLDRVMQALNPVELDAARVAVSGHIPPLAQMLGLLLLKDDGTAYNHIGWQVGGAPPPLGLLELTLQRVDGESPLQQRDRYKAQVAALQGECGTLYAVLSDIEDMIACEDPFHPALARIASLRSKTTDGAST